MHKFNTMYKKILLIIIGIIALTGTVGNVEAIAIVNVDSPTGFYTPGDTLSVDITLRHDGTIGVQETYVEACINPRESGLSLLTFIPRQDSCCPGNYWCFGGFVTLLPGQEETIKLTPQVPDSNAQDNCGTRNIWNGPGAYDVILTSVDTCCAGPSGSPSCQATSPFGWTYLASTINIQNEESVCGNNNCEVRESYNTCPTDCQQSSCGNQICDLWENAQSCPGDCKDTDDGGNSSVWLIWIIGNWVILLVVALIIIGFTIILRKEKVYGKNK